LVATKAGKKPLFVSHNKDREIIWLGEKQFFFLFPVAQDNFGYEYIDSKK